MGAPVKHAFWHNRLCSAVLGMLLIPSLLSSARAQQESETIRGQQVTTNNRETAVPWNMTVQVKVLQAGAKTSTPAQNVIVRVEGSDMNRITDANGIAVLTGVGTGEVHFQIVPIGVPKCRLKIPKPRARVHVVVNMAQKGSCQLQK